MEILWNNSPLTRKLGETTVDILRSVSWLYDVIPFSYKVMMGKAKITNNFVWLVFVQWLLQFAWNILT